MPRDMDAVAAWLQHEIVVWPSERPWPSHTIMRRLRRKDEWLARRVLSGRVDASIHFADLRRLLLTLGFSERVRGSHHVFVREGVEELINLQRAGAKAKPYQVRQVRTVLRRYKLMGGE